MADIGQVMKALFMVFIVCLSAYFLYANEQALLKDKDKPAATTPPPPNKEMFSEIPSSDSSSSESQKEGGGGCNKVFRITKAFNRIARREPTDSELERALELFPDGGEATTEGSAEDDKIAELIIEFATVAAAPKICAVLKAKFKEASREIDSQALDQKTCDELAHEVLKGSLTMADAERRVTYLGLKRHYDEDGGPHKQAENQQSVQEEDRLGDGDMVLLPGLKWNVGDRYIIRSPDESGPGSYSVSRIEAKPPQPSQDQTALIGTLLPAFYSRRHEKGLDT